MTDYSDAAIATLLRRQMSVAAAKQVVAASNLANVDTPGYKARELAFTDALEQSLAGALTATDPKHLQPAASSDPASREVQGLSARRDGNTVQIDRELLDMTRASGEFARAQTALAAKFRLVRYALNESK